MLPCTAGIEVEFEKAEGRASSAPETPYVHGRKFHELARKPENLTWEEAATVPLGALVAYQSLFTYGLWASLLITGAATPAGIWAVQLAKLPSVSIVAAIFDVESMGLVRSLDNRVPNFTLFTEPEQLRVIAPLAGCGLMKPMCRSEDVFGIKSAHQALTRRDIGQGSRRDEVYISITTDVKIEADLKIMVRVKIKLRLGHEVTQRLVSWDRNYLNRLWIRVTMVLGRITVTGS
ncbi:hypothetical protein VTG60DRAFT_4020 [Thermothelomyces hinnuleus]